MALIPVPSAARELGAIFCESIPRRSGNATFSASAWTLKGPRQVFAVAFIHLATRRVFVTPGTFKPDADWMETQAKAFLDHAAEEHLPCSIVTRDYDDKFSKAFDQVLKQRSVQVKRVGPQAPNLNAFIERWIQSLEYEALNHFIVFGNEYFDHIVSEYVAYYHTYRPHQGIGNVLLPRSSNELAVAGHNDESNFKPLSLADIKCEERLGGLLKHYYHQAA